VHQTVSGAPTDLEDQRSDAPDMEGDHARDCYSDCLVHHSTEGKIGLPSWPPTAPSCLRVIKGTPRRMEQYTKHSLSILRHPDSVPTQLICCVSDLSSIRVENSLCCPLSSSLHLCVSLLPYFCVYFVIIIVRAIGSKLWRFIANGRKTIRKKAVVFKLIIGSLERG
jgi:hypothetical protein